MGKVKLIAGVVAVVVAILVVLAIWRFLQQKRLKAREGANAHANAAPNTF